MKLKIELDNLLTEVQLAYEKSDIKQLCKEKNVEWNFSLVTTTLKPHGPLVLGFNWGASIGESYFPESSIEETDFSKENVGSLSRIFPYCIKYFGNDFLSQISQSNYCFFRSQTESQIEEKDIKLCEPIFDQLVTILEPSSILCFSSKLRDYLFAQNKIASHESKKISYKRGATNMTYEAIRAKLTSGIEIKFLPHPNYPIKGTARSEAWEFCCSNKIN